MPSIDYQSAKLILEETYIRTQRDASENQVPFPNEAVIELIRKVFVSTTTAYRETLLGCIVAKLSDPHVNVRLPYVSHGTDAFNGRTLDETVVNPFFQSKQIPSSRGPYLSVFRRTVRFTQETRTGLRDKSGYDAFLGVLTYIEGIKSGDELRGLLAYVILQFILLRETSKIPLARPQRISLIQYEQILKELLATPSGGRIPMLLANAIFLTLKEHYSLDWEIVAQQINAADRATGAAGDITIRSGERIVMAVEVTERPIERSRVESTFRNKIAPQSISDYLFLVHLPKVENDAKILASDYFAQGHDVNFFDLRGFILASLAAAGAPGRAVFKEKLLVLLDEPNIQNTLKVAWNEAIFGLARSPSPG